MSTEIQVSLPYAGGSVSGGNRTDWQAFDWCLVGGSNGRLGVSMRVQSNPHFVAFELWELDAEEKEATSRTVIHKELVPAGISAGNRYDYLHFSYPISLQKLNDYTFVVRSHRSTSYTDWYVCSIDPTTYAITQEFYDRDYYSWNHNYTINGSGNYNSYHHYQTFWMDLIEENVILTIDSRNNNPHAVLNERVWDPVEKTFSKNMVCGTYTNHGSYNNASNYLGTWSGNSTAYFNGQTPHHYDHSNNVAYPNILCLRSGWDTTGIYSNPQWMNKKTDRLGRIHYNMTASSSGSQLGNIRNNWNSNEVRYTLVYTPESIRQEGQPKWTICGDHGTGYLKQALIGQYNAYSNENYLGCAWLPLNIVPMSDHNDDATNGELCLKSLIIPGKNGFRVYPGGQLIAYENNDQDNDQNYSSNQRIIQTEWLDADHYIVFYVNDINSKTYWSALPSSGNRYGVRYKVIRVIDEYIARVVSYGEVESKWGLGKQGAIMNPFERVSPTEFRSHAFEELYSLYVPNFTPIAVNDAYSTDEDTTLEVSDLSLSLVANDADLDGDTLSVNTTPVTDVTQGTLTLQSNGTFTYVPGANFNGVDTFTYEVSDGNGGTAQASVTITVGSVNDAPVPVSDTYSVDENGTLEVAQLSLGLVANDTDLDGDPLTVNTTPIVDVTNGTLVLNADGTFTYTPYANYFGSDSFTYQVSDGNGGVATTSVSITVNEVYNAPPVISGIEPVYTLQQDQSEVIVGLATDAEGESVTWTYQEVLDNGVPSGLNGTTIVQSDNTFTITPAAASANFVLEFTATDTDGNSTSTQSDFSFTYVAPQPEPEPEPEPQPEPEPEPQPEPEPEPEVTAFSVTVSGGKFYLNGVEAPALDLTSGTEYTFNIDTSGHPFIIVNSDNVLITDPAETGSVSFTPVSGVSYEYKCQLHANMGNSITVS